MSWRRGKDDIAKAQTNNQFFEAVYKFEKQFKSKLQTIVHEITAHEHLGANFPQFCHWLRLNGKGPKQDKIMTILSLGVMASEYAQTEETMNSIILATNRFIANSEPTNIERLTDTTYRKIADCENKGNDFRKTVLCYNLLHVLESESHK